MKEISKEREKYPKMKTTYSVYEVKKINFYPTIKHEQRKTNVLREY